MFTDFFGALFTLFKGFGEFYGAEKFFFPRDFQGRGGIAFGGDLIPLKSLLFFWGAFLGEQQLGAKGGREPQNPLLKLGALFGGPEICAFGRETFLARICGRSPPNLVLFLRLGGLSTRGYLVTLF